MPINPNKSVRKLIAFRREKWREIDAFRASLRTVNESEAVRRLIDAGLEATAKQRSMKSVEIPTEPV